MTVVVFGDTGGHYKQLYRALEALGFDGVSGKLPENLTVIHLGDLVHRGPDSDLLAPLVDDIMRENPGQWVQLLGNHELHHVPGAPKFWRCECSAATVELINSWHENGLGVYAHGIDGEVVIAASETETYTASGLFFAHGGLSRGFWQELGEPWSPEATAALVNSLPVKVASRPGVMLGVPSTTRGLPPGPVWSLASEEVWETWRKLFVPFSQLHGHSAAFHWPSSRWFSSVSDTFSRATELFPEKRLSVTPMGEEFLFGADPAFGKTTSLTEQPHITLSLG